MKKLLLAIPLITGASWAGATYYTGSQTESAYDKLLVQLNDFKPFTLVNESYSTGLVSSHAVTKVMDSAGPDAQVLLRLQHDIEHSPIGVNEGNLRVSAANIKTTVIRDQAMSESMEQFIEGFNGAEPIQINTSVGFDGKTVNQFIVSQYEAEHDGANFKFDGAEYTADVDGEHFIGNGTIGEFVVSGDEGQLRLAPGRIDLNMTRIGDQVFSGSYGIEFDELSVGGPAIPVEVALKSIALSSETTLDNELLNSMAKFSVGDIDAPIPLNSVSVEAAVDHVSINAIETLANALSQLSVSSQLMGASDDDMLAIVNAYKSLVAPGTALSYKVNASNDGGEIDAVFGMNIIEESSAYFPAGGIASVETLRDVLNILEINLNLDADAAAVDMTPLAMLLTSPEAEQVIVADGVTYQSDVQVSNLIVDINGNPMSLELMIGEMLDMSLADLGAG